jgi:hypothetical protein
VTFAVSATRTTAPTGARSVLSAGAPTERIER